MTKEGDGEEMMPPEEGEEEGEDEDGDGGDMEDLEGGSTKVKQILKSRGDVTLLPHVQTVMQIAFVMLG